MKMDTHLIYTVYPIVCKYPHKQNKKNGRKSVYFVLSSCQNFPSGYIILVKKEKKI